MLKKKGEDLMKGKRAQKFVGAALLLTFVVPAAAALADDDSSRNIIKQGLLGAGVGAISASASGGKAGKGALIGAGTNVIGGALLDTLMPSSKPTPQVVYVQAPPAQGYAGQAQVFDQGPTMAATSGSAARQPQKKIIRKYNSDGKVVSEEEVWE
jgi:hypothetical protein